MSDLEMVLAGGVVVLVGKIVFDWLKKTRGDENRMKCPIDRSKVIADISWLRQVHDKCDADGVPLWYIPRSFEQTMSRLVENTAKQNVILERISNELKFNGGLLLKIVNGK